MMKKMIAALCLIVSGTAHSTMIGVSGNFINFGPTVYESREDGSVWQWLDLTVTNGISYKSLVADLADNNLLDNSSPLNGSAGAVADVIGLYDSYRGGWSTVSDTSVVNMFNSFFGLSLVDDQIYNFNRNVEIVNDFIKAFGDTYHEGFCNDTNSCPVDVYPQSKNSGYTYGRTSSHSFTLQSGRYNEAANVFDGYYRNLGGDSNFDLINTGLSSHVKSTYAATGTWLVREVKPANEAQPVSEPATALLFAVSLVAIGLRRKRHLSS
ncbi:PEP-CTERM sorting domain-containing protein [Thalassotalea sediminis]|uniref:PEP-CTERM sorting domain-containing protein n=1 Tax=Thalassotalea sediminis TaxID=1759089 RepID=UPI002572DFF6|nr:PEP-CTERM sorting domain-containing protein [Thalassotalea sediminis]